MGRTNDHYRELKALPHALAVDLVWKVCETDVSHELLADDWGDGMEVVREGGIRTIQRGAVCLWGEVARDGGDVGVCHLECGSEIRRKGKRGREGKKILLNGRGRLEEGKKGPRKGVGFVWLCPSRSTAALAITDSRLSLWLERAGTTHQSQSAIPFAFHGHLYCDCLRKRPPLLLSLPMPLPCGIPFRSPRCYL